MITFTKRTLLAAAAALPLMAGSAWAEGLISIIVTDPANPYWFTEGEVAKATAEELGYDATVAAHKGDTNVESNLIDAAITNGAKAIILDPANADGSVGVVRKATAAGIPVFLVNAEINESGIAIAQLVSNNAQGADAFKQSERIIKNTQAMTDGLKLRRSKCQDEIDEDRAAIAQIDREIAEPAAPRGKEARPEIGEAATRGPRDAPPRRVPSTGSRGNTTRCSRRTPRTPRPGTTCARSSTTPSRGPSTSRTRCSS